MKEIKEIFLTFFNLYSLNHIFSNLINNSNLLFLKAIELRSLSNFFNQVIKTLSF